MTAKTPAIWFAQIEILPYLLEESSKLPPHFAYGLFSNMNSKGPARTSDPEPFTYLSQLAKVVSLYPP